MEPMNRRVFIMRGTLTAVALRAALAGGVVGGAALMSGCDVVADIKHWVPVGIDAFNGLLNFLEGNGIIQVAAGGAISAAVALVQAALNQILADIDAYDKLVPKPQGALGKITASLKILSTNFQAFLASLNINDAHLLSIVTGIADLFLSTIAGFEALIPGLSSGALVTNRTYTVAGKSATLVPKQRPVRVFKKDFNKLVVAGGHPEMKLHISFFENL